MLGSPSLPDKAPRQAGDGGSQQKDTGLESGGKHDDEHQGTPGMAKAANNKIDVTEASGGHQDPTIEGAENPKHQGGYFARQMGFNKENNPTGKVSTIYSYKYSLHKHQRDICDKNCSRPFPYYS